MKIRAILLTFIAGLIFWPKIVLADPPSAIVFDPRYLAKENFDLTEKLKPTWDKCIYCAGHGIELEKYQYTRSKYFNDLRLLANQGGAGAYNKILFGNCGGGQFYEFYDLCKTGKFSEFKGITAYGTNHIFTIIRPDWADLAFFGAFSYEDDTLAFGLNEGSFLRYRVGDNYISSVSPVEVCREFYRPGSSQKPGKVGVAVGDYNGATKYYLAYRSQYFEEYTPFVSCGQAETKRLRPSKSQAVAYGKIEYLTEIPLLIEYFKEEGTLQEKKIANNVEYNLGAVGSILYQSPGSGEVMYLMGKPIQWAVNTLNKRSKIRCTINMLRNKGYCLEHRNDCFGDDLKLTMPPRKSTIQRAKELGPYGDTCYPPMIQVP